MPQLDISPRAFNLIVTEEVGDRRMYERSERFPTWPGGASGVTIGTGYDCGYVTREELDADWNGKIPDAMLAALHGVVGIHGSAAHSRALALRGIVDVPWDVALDVFRSRDVPKFIARCAATLPNFSKLAPDCRGAIVSLAFNRGPSWMIPASQDHNNRFLEMREIKQAMAARQFDRIPTLFRYMKRIWPPGASGHEDLTRRREHEAVLFEAGLKAVATVAAPSIVPTIPVKPTPAPAAVTPVSEFIAAFVDALSQALARRLQEV